MDKTFTDNSTALGVAARNTTNRSFRDSVNRIPKYKALKQAIWIYFFFLIFEGALRKWFLPGLATPLLLVRDPIALWLLFKCWQNRIFPLSPYIVIVVSIGIISIYTAFFFGHRNLFVALYGARILLLYFPLIFIIGRVFNREDVIEIGRVTLYLAIPMTGLIALQFYSPQSAWVNQGVGGVSGAGFEGALDYFRPPGTFSFTTGTTLFYSFVSVYICYFWIYPKKINKLILVLVTIGFLAAIPLSISRTLFFQAGISMLFALIAVLRKPRYAARITGALLIGCIASVLLFQTRILNTATEAFLARFSTANEQEGGVKRVLTDRYLGGLIEAINRSDEQPFFGYGLGMGTNGGSMLLTGNKKFLISEGEWGRVIGEIGPVMGLGIIVIRLLLSLEMFIAGYRKMEKGDILSWMLLAFGLLIIPQGGWAQPTSLGFCTLIGGLILASLQHPANSSIKRLVS